jgi:hypothetical protein
LFTGKHGFNPGKERLCCESSLQSILENTFHQNSIVGKKNGEYCTGTVCQTLLVGG